MLVGFAEYGNNRITLLRPARKVESAREEAHDLKPLRQWIESVFGTPKGQLGFERHVGRTPQDVIVSFLQRLLALTAVVCTTNTLGNLCFGH